MSHQSDAKPTDEQENVEEVSSNREIEDQLGPAESVDAQLTDLEEKLASATDSVLRMQAETENVRRRAQKDIANAHKFALEKFVTELLPIIDSLELAVSSHKDGEMVNEVGLLDGVNLTLKMLYSAFEKFGINQIDPRDDIFNPELHQAVSTRSEPGKAANTVLEVLQKGYILNDRLVRPALVVVAGS